MKLISDKNPLDVFKSASNLLNRAVAHTLGPSGANTAVVYGGMQKDAKFQIINDGKTIIDNLTSEDAEVALAIQTIRESVLSTNSIAGDGTTSTIILINALLEELTKDKYKRYSSFEICRNLTNIKRELLGKINLATMPISEEIPLSMIAETSLGSPEYVDLFVDAFEFAGTNGKVLLEKTMDGYSSVEKIDGISFNQFGFVPELVLNEQGMINTTFGECGTCIVMDDITNQNIILDILKQSKLNDRPILFFYQKMSGDIFRIMTGNLLKGGYKVYPISLEQMGNDLYKYGKLLEQITGLEKYDISKHNLGENIPLGSVSGCIFTKEGVIIKPDKDKVEEIAKYIQENKFILSTKSAIIKAGAGNAITLEELFRRFEDAIYSCMNALKNGVCTGGGTTYKIVVELVRSDDNLGDFSDAIIGSMSSIYKQLLVNCDVIDENVLLLPKLQEDGSYKLDQNYMAYDSVTTIEQVITNAFDIVISIFSTKTLICDPQR